MQVRFFQSVFFLACLAGCTTPRERPAPPSAAPTDGAAPPSAGGPSAVPSPLAPPATSGPPALAPSQASPPASAVAAVSANRSEATPTGSAYVGCGLAIPADRLWDETTEAQALEAITLAKQCARQHGRRLLLEFVAPWCADCREMARLDDTPLVRQTLATRFERVRINVGKWDRHEALRENYQVRALATYIVIDPVTSRVLAQTTLEPITRKRGKKLSAEDWAAWLARH